MPPLITREEALQLGELEDHDAIRELVDRAWEARRDRFGDSTDLCSLVNAKSGGCAEDCGFCAQSRFAEAETPLHALMEPEQILEHAKAYDDQDRTALRRYAFLDDLLPTAARPWPLRRAVPTIGFRRT